MVGGHKRSSRRRDITVGKNISKTAPRPVRKKKYATAYIGKRVSDIPLNVRKQVRDVLKKHEKWGKGKHLVAAESIIKICAKNGVRLELITDLLLRRSADKQLKQAIAKRVQAMGKQKR